MVFLVREVGVAPGAVGGLLAVLSLGAVLGAGVAVGNVVKGSFRQAYVPHRLLGRVTVTMHVVNYGTMPLGAVLGGTLGTALGLRPAMWWITGGLALSGLILLVGPIRRHRDLPERPALPRP